MLVDYEEKTFENFFNCELCQYDSCSPYSIGQCREGYLGFDASFYTANYLLWGYFGCPMPTSTMLLNELYRFFQVMHSDISLKANVLFQYKRPEYMERCTAREWQKWGKPYFRYAIYPHQQDILEEVHRQFHNKAVVLYVAPSATSEQELIDSMVQKSIVASSNFTEAIKLKGHGYNTYVKDKRYSIACSEPQEIDSFDFKKFIYSEMEAPAENAENFINQTAERLSHIMSKDGVYRKVFERLVHSESWYQAVHGQIVLQGLTVIAAFCIRTGVQWGFKVRWNGHN